MYEVGDIVILDEKIFEDVSFENWEHLKNDIARIIEALPTKEMYLLKFMRGDKISVFPSEIKQASPIQAIYYRSCQNLK